MWAPNAIMGKKKKQTMNKQPTIRGNPNGQQVYKEKLNLTRSGVLVAGAMVVVVITKHLYTYHTTSSSTPHSNTMRKLYHSLHFIEAKKEA